MKQKLRDFLFKCLGKIVPEIYELRYKTVLQESYVDPLAKLYPKAALVSSKVGAYSYIGPNSVLNYTTVGKFCSIGPNLISGWGVHPIDGLSTHPMFYSSCKQNGVSLVKEDKIVETKPVVIGNDVFIGMNVSILDGVTIGDGAVIGAGAVVSKDIPPYSVAYGNPIKVRKLRFDEATVERLLQIKWWDWPEEKLIEVEQMFFDIDTFIAKNLNSVD